MLSPSTMIGAGAHERPGGGAGMLASPSIRLAGAATGSKRPAAPTHATASTASSNPTIRARVECGPATARSDNGGK